MWYFNRLESKSGGLLMPARKKVVVGLLAIKRQSGLIDDNQPPSKLDVFTHMTLRNKIAIILLIIQLNWNIAELLLEFSDILEPFLFYLYQWILMQDKPKYHC